MKYQRARICPPADGRKITPEFTPFLGKEVWVEIAQPVVGEGFDRDKKFLVAKGYYTPYRLPNTNRRGMFPADILELLARGPEDFCEITDLLSWEQWLIDNGIEEEQYVKDY